MKTRRRYPRLLAAILGLAVLVRLPALAAPPLLDDQIQAAMVSGAFPAPRAWWDLYAFARADARDRDRLRAEGTLPWWTADNFQLVMLRPLSSGLVWFDHVVLRHWALARAHSLAWMLAWVVASATLLRRRVGDEIALGAALLLALDDSLTIPLAWHANRCAFVALTLAALGVEACCRWLDGGRLRAGLVAVAWAVLACSAGEYAWTLLPSAALWARVTRSPRRLSVYLGLAVLAFGYLLARGVAGAGVRSCVLYPELIYLPLFAPRWVIAMLGDFLLGVGIEQPEPWLGVVASRAQLALLGSVLVAVAWSRSDADPTRRARLRWALGSGLAAIAVVSTAWPSSRLMGAASLCGAALTAMLVAWAWRDRWGRTAALLLLAAQVPWTAVHTFTAARRYRRDAARNYEDAVTLLPSDFGVGPARGADESMYVLNAVHPEEVFFGRYTRRARDLPVPGRWFVLASTERGIFAYRESATALALVSPATLLEGVSSRFFRSVGGPVAGARVIVGDATLSVVAAGPNGPQRLRVEFGRDLDDPALWLVVSTPAGLRRFTPPRIGASVEIAPPRLAAAGPR